MNLKLCKRLRMMARHLHEEPEGLRSYYVTVSKLNWRTKIESNQILCNPKSVRGIYRGLKNDYRK